MKVLKKLSKRLGLCWLVLLLFYGLHGYLRQRFVFTCR